MTKNRNEKLSIEEKTEKIMKEPSPVEVSNYEEKIRRNLMIGSALAFVFTYLELIPSPNSRFLGGLMFENLTPKTIYVLSFVFIVYEFIQYFWLVSNN